MWYIAVAGRSEGPYGREDIIRMLENGELGKNNLVFSRGMINWSPIGSVPEFQEDVESEPWTPPVPVTSISSGRASHEIDFEIHGEEMQFVEIELDPQESVVAEAGSMMFMENGIEMNTIFGDGSAEGESKGLMGKLFDAGKRVLTGESLFMTVFTNMGSGKQHVSFSSPYPGKIIPVDLKEVDGKLVCQKDSFLCAAKGVSVGIDFRKKIGVGLFGGEGFIMQKLEGDGLAFIHSGGTVTRRELAPGETLKVDTGCLVALTKDVNYDITFVKGIKSVVFGGEGLFFVTLTGPGSVWLQSLPFSRLAARILAGASGARKEEGSVLGGLGNMIDGK